MFRRAHLFVAGLSLTALVFAAPSMVRAEDAPPEKPAKKERAKGERPEPGQRLQKQLDELNLTADQKAKIDPIVEKMKQDLQALQADNSVPKDGKRSKMMEITKSAWTQIKAHLTPEQNAQLEKAHEAHGPGKKPGDKAHDKAPGDKAPGDKAPEEKGQDEKPAE